MTMNILALFWKQVMFLHAIMFILIQISISDFKGEVMVLAMAIDLIIKCSCQF